MLKLCSISSGSKGNCLYVASDRTSLIVDAGISLCNIERALHVLGTSADVLEGVLVTHTHSDHIKGVLALCKKYKTRVYCHAQSAQYLIDIMEADGITIFEDCFDVGDIEVSPFELSHDVHCVGFRLECQSNSASIATDMGYAPQSVVEALSGSEIIFVESNHDIDMLRHNREYSNYLKSRILSDKGHLSNIDCARLISELAKKGTRRFVLSHLSDKNNYPELAFSSVCQVLGQYGIVEGRDVYIDIAMQGRLSHLYWCK